MEEGDRSHRQPTGARAGASAALGWHLAPRESLFWLQVLLLSRLPPTVAFTALSVAQQPSFLSWRHLERGSLAADGCVTHQHYHP